MTRIAFRALGASLILASALAVAADAAEPQRRPGLWDEQITTAETGATQHTQGCIGGEHRGIFQDGKPASPSPDACSNLTPETTPIPGGVSFHTVCHPAQSLTTEMWGSATGDFDSAYAMRMKTRLTSPLGMATVNMRVSARWLGACPAGMGPGDTRDPGAPVPPR